MIDPITFHRYEECIRQGLSQRFACNALGIHRKSLYRYLKAEEKRKSTIRGNAVIKFLDIETTPTISAHFGRFNLNMQQANVISEGGRCVVACVKTLGQSGVRKYFIQDPAQRYNGEDLDVVANLWEEIETADIVVGHNIKGFDIPTLKARIAYWGLKPLRGVSVVDTLQIAKQMRFNSNRLDALGAYLGVGRKIDTGGIRLWIDVMEGKEAALNDMLTYCEQDVLLLERVYLKIKAYDRNPPNMRLYQENNEIVCNSCGSKDIQETGHIVRTPLNIFKEMECKHCGHRQRSRESLLDREERGTLMTSNKI